MLVLQRHRMLSVSLLVLTLLATTISFFKQPLTYQASASVAFIPSQSFGEVSGGGNRYLAFTTSLNELGDVIRYEETSSAQVSALAAAGHTSSYTITDPIDTTAPILLIVTSGSNKENVEHTLSGLVTAITARLSAMQSSIEARDKIGVVVLTFTTEPMRVSVDKERVAALCFLVGLIASYGIVIIVESSQGRRARQGVRSTKIDQPAKGISQAPTCSARTMQDVVSDSRKGTEVKVYMQSNAPVNG